MKHEVVSVRLLLPVLLSTIITFWPETALYAQETQLLRCPHNDSLGSTNHAALQGWPDLPLAGQLSGAEIREQNGVAMLACVYQSDGEEQAIMRPPPEKLTICRPQLANFSFVCESAQKIADTVAVRGKICQASIQNQIEWNYKGQRRWARNNLEKICQGAENSLQPGVCFNRVMHGNLSYGDGSRWRWSRALKLCAGTLDANATIACFSQEINRQSPWPQAIDFCRVKP